MSQESIRTLEHVRQRLNNLATSLGALRRDLESNEALPSWPSIQNSANLLSHNLQSLHATLSSAQPLLTSAHAYPLPSFPGRTQEDLLGQLLRKKLQPPVEDWIEKGIEKAGSFAADGENGHLQNGSTGLQSHAVNGKAGALNGKQIEELWNSAGPEANRIAREIGEDSAFEDEFTLAEREQGIENVVTGLRRKFWESDDEGEEGDEDGGEKAEKMEVDVEDKRPEILKGIHRSGIDESRPMMPLEAILRFTNSGVLPGTAGSQVRR